MCRSLPARPPLQPGPRGVVGAAGPGLRGPGLSRVSSVLLGVPGLQVTPLARGFQALVRERLGKVTAAGMACFRPDCCLGHRGSERLVGA